MDPKVFDFVFALKNHLTNEVIRGQSYKGYRDDKQPFVYTVSMCGDTEGGFYEKTIFDFDLLLREIDEFAKTFAV